MRHVSRKSLSRETLAAAIVALLWGAPAAPARAADAVAPGLAERCRALAAVAGEPGARRREAAVRDLAEAPCADFDAYAPFLEDRDPWVVDAVVAAVARHALTDAVPFLIDHLDDRRRILTGEGAWTISEAAHRALRALTGQSFRFDPAAPAEARAAARDAWRAWHEAHRAAPREAWIRDGIERARGWIAGEYAGRRLEGLRLLALVGEPAVPALREALARGREALSPGIVCSSDEPPRVTDEVSCALLVQNASAHRVAFAPDDGVAVRVRATGATAPIGAAASPPAAGPLAGLEARLVDLEPGGIVRRDFKVGPVPSAGRFTVEAILRDHAAWLAAPPAAKAPAIAATTVLRFEQ